MQFQKTLCSALALLAPQLQRRTHKYLSQIFPTFGLWRGELEPGGSGWGPDSLLLIALTATWTRFTRRSQNCASWALRCSRAAPHACPCLGLRGEQEVLPLQMGSESCPLLRALLGSLLEQWWTLALCAHVDFNPTLFLGSAGLCSCKDALGAWAGRSWAGTKGLLQAPRGAAGAQQAGGEVGFQTWRAQEVVPKYFLWEILCRTWRGCSRICDVEQASLILCSQSSGSAWAGLGIWKTQCSLFLLSDFLDFGLVLKFPSSCFFYECSSSGCAHALSSSSRNRCLKHEVTEQDADSWMNLHLEAFGYVTRAFLSQFPVAIYFRLFEIVFHCLAGALWCKSMSNTLSWMDQD